ncbi:MAG: DUF2061 domain-containing protein [Kiloniellaceae bacterium]
MRLELLKTASFAVLHFAVGFGVTYVLTGSVAIATGVALVEPAVNTVVFYFHERAWRRLAGVKRQGALALPAMPAPRRQTAGAWGLPQGACAKPPD